MVLLKYDIHCHKLLFAFDQSLPYLWKTFPWITSELVCLKKQEIAYYSGIISTPPSRHSLAVVSLRYEKDKRLREDIDNSPPTPLLKVLPPDIGCNGPRRWGRCTGCFRHICKYQHHNEYEVGRSIRLSHIHNVELGWIWQKVPMRRGWIRTSCNQGCTPHPCKPTPRQRIVAGGWKYIICRSNCEMQFPYRIEGMKKTNTLGIV